MKKEERVKVCRYIRKLFRKKTQVTKRIMVTKFQIKLTKLREILSEVNEKLIENKESYRFKK